MPSFLTRHCAIHTNTLHLIEFVIFGFINQLQLVAVICRRPFFTPTAFILINWAVGGELLVDMFSSASIVSRPPTHKEPTAMGSYVATSGVIAPIANGSTTGGNTESTSF